MSMPLLAGRDLGQRYRMGGRTVVALRGVSLVLRAGAGVGLVGESGSGKSTLGRILTGLESPTTGQVSFQVRDLGALDRQQRRDFRCRVQYVFQDPLGALNPRKRVRDSLGAPLRDLLALRGADRECRAGELLEAVGLTREFLLRVTQAGADTQPARVRMQYIRALWSPGWRSMLLIFCSSLPCGGEMSFCKASDRPYISRTDDGWKR
jgi:ABC-type glutathione transport system ATPase component